MTTLGKYIGGGFPFGAFGGRKEIMSRLDPRLGVQEGGIPHSGTYNKNVFTMKAGVAAAKVLSAEAIRRCNELGDSLRDGVRKLLKERKIGEVQITGFGSLVGVHFVGPNESVLRDIFFFWMLKEGVWIGRRGFVNFGLCHEVCHVEQVMESFEGFLDLL